MARKKQYLQSGRTVLLVDDSKDYLASARSVIARDGHDVLTAGSASEALDILRERDVDLVLVDYIMPGMSGGEFVRQMRDFKPHTQVILQTGYASEHPPRELLRQLDIQGFHDKSDGPDKLALWVDVGLKAAYTVQLLANSRAGLRYILEATPALHRIQPLEDLLQGILLQTSGLLGVANSFVAAGSAAAVTASQSDDGFLAMTKDGGDLSLHAATGRFRVALRVDECLDSGELALVASALKAPHVTASSGATIAPLRIGAETIGLIYLDRAIDQAWETELIEIFANQAAVAIQNVSLYEMAALDVLTRVATRRFFDLSVTRELRSASRSGAALGLLIVDVDQMKHLNDSFGHLAGDRALTEIGRRLRHSIRATDVAGRIGGDEFAVVLPATDAEGVAVVLERTRRALADMTIDLDGRTIPVKASLGAAVLEGAFDSTADRRRFGAVLELMSARLLAAADAAMYADKRHLGEGDAVRCIQWLSAAECAALPHAPR